MASYRAVIPEVNANEILFEMTLPRLPLSRESTATMPLPDLTENARECSQTPSVHFLKKWNP